MVTTDTFHHAVWAASPAAESPEVREYAAFRLKNTVEIGHELGAEFAVYWPGSLGYQVQGAVEETQTLGWYADALNAACEHDIRVAHKTRPPYPQALPGGQAVRAAGRDPAAHLGRHAGFHRLGPADASGDGGSQPGIPARADVGRGSARGARPRFDRGQAVALRYQRRLPPQARRGYRRRPGQPVRLAERAGAAAQPRLQRARSTWTTNRLAPPAISASSR